MIIKTKSVQAKNEKSDGIRICIMRRIRPEFVFDIWMPTLAPSTELLKSYHDRRIDWKKYERRFAKEVLNRNQKYLDIVLDISQKDILTLLCWEDTPEMCHRRLVAEHLKKINPLINFSLK